MIEVLPCPYCGNAPEILDNEDNSCMIMCTKYACNLYFAAIGEPKEEVIKFWNEEINKLKEKKNEVKN